MLSVFSSAAANTAGPLGLRYRWTLFVPPLTPATGLSQETAVNLIQHRDIILK